MGEGIHSAELWREEVKENTQVKVDALVLPSVLNMNCTSPKGVGRQHCSANSDMHGVS